MTTDNGSRDPFWDGLVAKYGVGPDAPFDQDIAERRLDVGGEDAIDRDVLLDIVREVTGADLREDSVGSQRVVAGPRLVERPVDEGKDVHRRSPRRASRGARLSMWIGGAAAAAVVAAVIARPLWDGQSKRNLHWIDAMVVAGDSAEPLDLRNSSLVRVVDLAMDSIASIKAFAETADEELQAAALQRLDFLWAVAFDSAAPLPPPASIEFAAELDVGVKAESLVLASGGSSPEDCLVALQRLAAIASQSIYQLRHLELDADRLLRTREGSFILFERALR